jgi:hypothetical protein
MSTCPVNNAMQAELDARYRAGLARGKDYAAQHIWRDPDRVRWQVRVKEAAKSRAVNPSENQYFQGFIDGLRGAYYADGHKEKHLQDKCVEIFCGYWR